MNNMKEMIKNFDYIRLDVIDAWQFPAVYIVYKSGVQIEDIKEEYFIKEMEEEECNEFIKKIESLNLEDWLYDYLPERNETIQDEYTWKLIVAENGKKVVKKGKNKSPENFEKLESLMIELTYREDEE